MVFQTLWDSAIVGATVKFNSDEKEQTFLFDHKGTMAMLHNASIFKEKLKKNLHNTIQQNDYH